MRVFKNKWFQKWAAKEGMSDEVLLVAVEEMEDGLIDAELGGHVVKKRVALPGRGKRVVPAPWWFTSNPIRRSSSMALLRMNERTSVSSNSKR